MSSLSDLPLNKSAVVTGFDPALSASRRERFEDLGLIPDTRIVRERRAPLGDPLAFRIRGSLLCLRRDEARMIRVRLLNNT